MQKEVSFALGILVGVAVMLVVGAATPTEEPAAPTPAPVPEIGRYQIGTWAASTGTLHGYYILDTVTGRITGRGQ